MALHYRQACVGLVLFFTLLTICFGAAENKSTILSTINGNGFGGRYLQDQWKARIAEQENNQAALSGTPTQVGGERDLVISLD